MAILKQPLDEGDATRAIHWIHCVVDKTIFREAVLATLREDGVVASEGTRRLKGLVSDYTKKRRCTPRIILLYLPVATTLAYETIEAVKDMLFFSAKQPGCMVNGPCPHMIIFAPNRPNTNMMSRDRWRIGELVGDAIQWEHAYGLQFLQQ